MAFCVVTGLKIRTCFFFFHRLPLLGTICRLHFRTSHSTEKYLPLRKNLLCFEGNLTTFLTMLVVRKIIFLVSVTVLFKMPAYQLSCKSRDETIIAIYGGGPANCEARKIFYSKERPAHSLINKAGTFC